MITKEQIIEKLKTVEDPEIKIDIWTLGLIYEIDILNEKSLYLKMTYTTPMCPFGAMMQDNVRAAMLNLGFEKVNIDVVFEPAWKPTDELREMLGV